ncbi:MAG TPA: hypothetical protein DHW63_09455 [Hyphomonadaceae bacterium]|nr:hypothetical protein [Hyphomonadaceae bacterium]
MILALALLSAGCANSSRSVAEGLYRTTSATEQGAVIDEMVERWYDNARAYPSCRSRQNHIYADEGRGRESIGAQEFFARLRSPAIFVVSGPERVEERIDVEDGGHGDSYPYEYHTLYRFDRARILYAQDSDYARIWPISFQLSELAAAPRIPSDFVSANRSYLVFANFIEYEPRLDALVICELSDPATLPLILEQPTQ